MYSHFRRCAEVSQNDAVPVFAFKTPPSAAAVRRARKRMRAMFETDSNTYLKTYSSRVLDTENELFLTLMKLRLA